MTGEQIEFFRNDIMNTIRDARAKGMDEDEVAHRLNFVWKITMADLGM